MQNSFPKFFAELRILMPYGSLYKGKNKYMWDLRYLSPFLPKKRSVIGENCKNRRNRATSTVYKIYISIIQILY